MMLPSFSDFSTASTRVAPLLVDAGLRGTAILLLAALATLSLRRASAAFRHGIWLLAVIGLLLLPILSATLPAWNVLPTALRTVAPPKIMAALPAGNGIPVSTTAENSAAVPASTSISRAISHPSPTHSSPTHVAPALQPHSLIPAARSPFAWTFWLMLVWFIGASLILFQLMLGYLSLGFLQRHCTRLLAGEIATQLIRLGKQFPLRRAVILLSSPRRTMPMTWGLWHSRILLPQEAADWTVEKCEAVLLHELAHIRRGDCVAQLIVQFACALYWFNPLMWIARNRMQLERERACDDLVLNTGARPSTYAQHLLKSAAAMPALPFVSAAAAMAKPSTLEERLRAILDPQRNRSTMNKKTLSAATLLVLIALFPIAVLHAQDASSTPPPARRTPPTTRPQGTMSRSPMGFGGSREASDSNASATDGPTCTFDATIYDVRLPADKLGLLDANDLAKASGTAADFEKALAAFGPIQPLYRVNQSVRLTKDRISIGTEVPVITNSQVTGNGKTINSVSYQNTGAIFTLAGKPISSSNVDVNLGIEVSAISDGGAAISENVKASLFRVATLSYKGPVTPDKSFVILSFNGGTRDEEGRAVAYIARVTLGTPQSDTPAP
jgi:beta-lactamase regulating signal transducer with metallopeptidase domain